MKGKCASLSHLPSNDHRQLRIFCWFVRFITLLPYLRSRPVNQLQSSLFQCKLSSVLRSGRLLPASLAHRSCDSLFIVRSHVPPQDQLRGQVFRQLHRLRPGDLPCGLPIHSQQFHGHPVHGRPVPVPHPAPPLPGNHR